VIVEDTRETITRSIPNGAPKKPEDPGEIDLYDYYLVVRKRWKVIAVIFLSAVIGAVIISFLMTKIYRAETTILPIQSGPSSRMASMVAELSDLALFGPSLPSTSADKLMNVLESRTVRENIIRKLNLREQLFRKGWTARIWIRSRDWSLQDAVMELGDMTRVRKDRKGELIRLSVDFHDPEMGAKIANQYPEELQRFLGENALSLAKRARIFLETRYEDARRQLLTSEEVLRDFQTEHKLVAMDEQTEAAVKAIADLKAQIMAKEVELGVFRKFVTDTNPNVIRIKDEIRSLSKQLAAMESRKESPKGDVFPAFNEAPTLGLEYARLRRNVAINEKLFELLTEQYEMAKIEEAREAVAFQVVDKAVPPEIEIRPKTKLMIVFVGCLAILFGTLFVSFLHYLESAAAKRNLV